MNKKNELATIDTQALQLIPSAEDIEFVREELQTLDKVPFGRIKIGAAGAGIFQVFTPGDDEGSVETSIEGVILTSSKANGYWEQKYGANDNKGDKAPDCSSTDGITGTDKLTGEVRECVLCPRNQFGSADNGSGRGKLCKNMRRLFLLRPGEIFPYLLVLPPTGLTAYDNYRVRLMSSRNHMYGVLTKITLRTAKNDTGTAYSTPVFSATGVIPAADLKLIKTYADNYAGAAARIGVAADDTATPQLAQRSGFVEASDSEIADVFPADAQREPADANGDDSYSPLPF